MVVYIIHYITDAQLQTYAYMWTISLFLILHFTFHPYYVDSLYYMEAGALSAIVVVSNLLTLYSFGENSTPSLVLLTVCCILTYNLFSLESISHVA